MAKLATCAGQLLSKFAKQYMEAPLLGQAQGGGQQAPFLKYMLLAG